ncbi:MAG: hypothetical protein ACFFD7_08180 [Candidatus Thorarchaeota archaeon]
MRRRDKSIMKSLVGIVALVIVTSWTLNIREPSIIHEPPDFYGTSREVSLNEMVDFANKNNMSIYLPSELPTNIELTIIYLKDSPFIAIVVYSAEGNKDYKTAELVIQITPSELTPTYNELRLEAETSEYKSALEINNWPVIVDEMANSGGSEAFKEKYGDYTLLVRVWIDGMRYNLVAPTLTKESGEMLVRYMRLLIP